MEIKYPIRPSGHHLLIKLDSAPTKTTAGIYLPDDNVYKTQFAKTRGVVVAMGPTAYTDPDFHGHRWCEVGDVVFVSKDVGLFIPEKEGDVQTMWKLCNDNDVLGVYIVKENLENER